MNPTSNRAAYLSLLDKLRALVSEHEMVDVGAGAEVILGVPATKLVKALDELRTKESYGVFYIPIGRPDTGLTTVIKVLTGPDKNFVDVVNNREKVYAIPGAREALVALRKSRAARNRKIEKRRREREAQEKKQARKDNIQTSRGMKLRGYSNVAIAAHLGVAESTVRNWLSKPQTAEEVLEGLMTDDLTEVPDELLSKLSESIEFAEVFPDEKREGYVTRVRVKHNAVVDKKTKQVQYSLNFTATFIHQGGDNV